jgi:hypothetical protein
VRNIEGLQSGAEVFGGFDEVSDFGRVGVVYDQIKSVVSEDKLDESEALTLSAENEIGLVASGYVIEEVQTLGADAVGRRAAGPNFDNDVCFEERCEEDVEHPDFDMLNSIGFISLEIGVRVMVEDHLAKGVDAALRARGDHRALVLGVAAERRALEGAEGRDAREARVADGRGDVAVNGAEGR